MRFLLSGVVIIDFCEKKKVITTWGLVDLSSEGIVIMTNQVLAPYCQYNMDWDLRRSGPFIVSRMLYILNIG